MLQLTGDWITAIDLQQPRSIYFCILLIVLKSPDVHCEILERWRRGLMVGCFREIEPSPAFRIPFHLPPAGKRKSIVDEDIWYENSQPFGNHDLAQASDGCREHPERNLSF